MSITYQEPPGQVKVSGQGDAWVWSAETFAKYQSGDAPSAETALFRALKALREMQNA